MTYDYQLTVDCRDPHVLAEWWAETLGWLVEPSNEEFIKSMIEAGHASDDDTTRHHGVLVWRTGAAIRHPDSPAAGGRDRILFNLVPEEKTGKNRLHLDIRVGAERIAAVRAQLEARGARFLWSGRQGPQAWETMADPEGNEFCVT